MQILGTTAEGYFLSAQGASAVSNCTVRDANVSKEGRSAPLAQALKRANVNNNTVNTYSAPSSRKKINWGLVLRGIECETDVFNNALANVVL